MTLETGTRLGTYQILAKLGAGGMGEVYRARDTKLHREVAIKVLPGLFSSDQDGLARLEREARILATFNHPNIATVYGLEERPGLTAIVMELIEGEALDARVRAKGKLSVDETITIARQLVDALDAAHERGIIHRDLKPANIKLTPDSVAKVLDFGLARDPVIASGETDTYVSPVTQPGLILGTAAYMSPEQARGLAVDRRADIWAFGCVLYECLTGASPFAGPSISDVIAHVLEREPDWNALPLIDTAPTRSSDPALSSERHEETSSRHRGCACGSRRSADHASGHARPGNFRFVAAVGCRRGCRRDDRGLLVAVFGPGADRSAPLAGRSPHELGGARVQPRDFAGQQVGRLLLRMAGTQRRLGEVPRQRIDDQPHLLAEPGFVGTGADRRPLDLSRWHDDRRGFPLGPGPARLRHLDHSRSRRRRAPKAAVHTAGDAMVPGWKANRVHSRSLVARRRARRR